MAKKLKMDLGTGMPILSKDFMNGLLKSGKFNNERVYMASVAFVFDSNDTESRDSLYILDQEIVDVSSNPLRIADKAMEAVKEGKSSEEVIAIIDEACKQASAENSPDMPDLSDIKPATDSVN